MDFAEGKDKGKSETRRAGKSDSEFISPGNGSAPHDAGRLFDITTLHRSRPTRATAEQQQRRRRLRWLLTNNEINLVNHSFRICLQCDELWGACVRAGIRMAADAVRRGA